MLLMGVKLISCVVLREAIKELVFHLIYFLRVFSTETNCHLDRPKTLFKFEFLLLSRYCSVADCLCVAELCNLT